MRRVPPALQPVAKSEASSPVITPEEAQRAQESVSPLKLEALEAARAFLNQAFYKCGDFYFMRVKAISELPYPSDPPQYWQIHGFNWTIKGAEVIPAPLTDAERLNGVAPGPLGEYRGEILITGTAYRRYGKGAWGPWENWETSQGALITFQFMKQQTPCSSTWERPTCLRDVAARYPFRFGKWVVGNSNFVAPEQIVPVDCNAIPPGSLKVSQAPDPKPTQIKNPAKPVRATVVANPLLVPPDEKVLPLPKKSP